MATASDAQTRQFYRLLDELNRKRIRVLEVQFNNRYGDRFGTEARATDGTDWRCGRDA